MPKLKTHKGAAKRFRTTATGKIKRGHSHARHILTKKTNKRKRLLDIDALVSKSDLKTRRGDVALRQRLVSMGDRRVEDSALRGVSRNLIVRN